MPHILTINAGSSSIRFALFASASPPIRLLDGKLDRIGGAAATLTAARAGQPAAQIKIDAAICIAVENKPARISTLGHVVGSIDCDHTRQTSHGSIRIAAICRI